MKAQPGRADVSMNQASGGVVITFVKYRNPTFVVLTHPLGFEGTNTGTNFCGVNSPVGLEGTRE
jgi:hypothetical protein